MTVVYRQATYKIPGIYQWVKPSTAAGSGPFGSTYFETIVTCVGGGSGGAGGNASSLLGPGALGGNAGNGGGYGQATYLPAALSAFEDVIVGAGTYGQAGAIITGSGQRSVLNSSDAGQSSFGALIVCGGGEGSGFTNGGTSTITGGSNVTSYKGGCTTTPSATFFPNQPGSGPGILGSGGTSWPPTGNVAGGGGGCVYNTGSPSFLYLGGGGGSVNGVGGGTGVTDSNVFAGSGSVPGAGGGCSFASGVYAPTAGNGANAINNTGAGGGGGGGACQQNVAGGGNVTSGSGGNGSNGFVQITDVFTYPTPGQVQYYNWDLVTWFHMMNQARQISLTGQYQS